MDFDMINQKVTEALREVLDNDRHLIVHGINEPTISHRLALYLAACRRESIKINY
jgi:hypothetical protein